MSKIFNLISKSKLIKKLELIEGLKEVVMKGLYNQWKEKEISEWSYYKHLWAMKGGLTIIRDIIDMVK